MTTKADKPSSMLPTIFPNGLFDVINLDIVLGLLGSVFIQFYRVQGMY